MFNRRKLIEETLKETRETFHALINATQETLIMIDTKGSKDENPEILISRLQGNIATFNKLGTPDYNISLSVGIVRYDPNNPSSLDELMTKADVLMYEEKRNKQH